MRPIDVDLFQADPGCRDAPLLGRIGFRRDTGGQVDTLILGGSPAAAFHRRPWFQDAKTTVVLLCILVISFLTGLYRILRPKAWPKRSVRSSLSTDGLVALLCLSCLASLVVFGLAIGSADDFLARPPDGLDWGAGLGLVSVLLLALSAVSIARDLRRRHFAAVALLGRTAIAFAAAVFITLLVYWNPPARRPGH